MSKLKFKKIIKKNNLINTTQKENIHAKTANLFHSSTSTYNTIKMLLICASTFIKIRDYDDDDIELFLFLVLIL